MKSYKMDEKFLKIATPSLALGNFCTLSSSNLNRASKFAVLRKVVTPHLLQATSMRKFAVYTFFSSVFEKNEKSLRICTLELYTLDR